TDLDCLRARADGGEERERRAELACEVVDAEVRAIEAELFGSDGEIDRLQEGVGCRANAGVRRWRPMPERKKAELLHVSPPASARRSGAGRRRVELLELRLVMDQRQIRIAARPVGFPEARLP